MCGGVSELLPGEQGPRRWGLVAQLEGELRQQKGRVVKAQWGGGDRVALEDSGLILGAEAPLRVWLWVHNPGNTSVGWGLLVQIGRFQLPNKETALGLRVASPSRTQHTCPSLKVKGGHLQELLGTTQRILAPLEFTLGAPVAWAGRGRPLVVRELSLRTGTALLQAFAEDDEDTGQRHRAEHTGRERVSHRPSARPPGTGDSSRALQSLTHRERAGGREAERP